MEYGCIGEKLGHSFSKEIHAKIGNYPYELKEILPEKVGKFIKSREYKGINVTIPYKQTVMPFLDEISDAAKAIGAVNTIVNRGGKLYGYNTDFYGMKSLIEKSGVEINGKKVIIAGFGGTSKTAFAVANKMGAQSVIRLSRHGEIGSVSYDEAYKNHRDAQVIINTTPVGMYPNTNSFAIDIEKFPELSGVIDAIYNPLHTELILNAKKRGIKASGGLYMLVCQAVVAAEKFFESPMSGKADEIYSEILCEKQNIVLIGMPASGKTTIGRILSDRMGRKLIDTDEEIVKKFDMPITDIFKKYGEREFRLREEDAVSSVSTKQGSIIATGGGAILSAKNIKNLNKNGRIYFIDRPVEDLIATPDRPLSCTAEELLKRYDERKDIYNSVCDKKLSGRFTAEEFANMIEKDFYNENTCC